MDSGVTVSLSSIVAIALCNSVPRSAYVLLSFGGILATNATEPGQLMTRLAVLPPTIKECEAIVFSLSEVEARL